MMYGSYNELVQIVKTLADVLTAPETEYESSRCIFAVLRVPEDGTEETRVGDGVVWGTND